MVALFFISTIFSCTKTAVEFGDDGNTTDPNITITDTFTLGISTIQLDSFPTKNSGYFIAGLHTDAALGEIESKSYFELLPPTVDLRDCNNCVFDSLVFYTKASGGYLGDTTSSFTMSLHEVTEAMDETVRSVGYNVSKLAYNNNALGSITTRVRPTAGDVLKMRLSDDFGKNLFRMLRANSDTITDTDAFKRFLKGFCMVGDNSNKAVYYFTEALADSAVIRLHYTIAGATPTSATADFSITADTYAFNGFTYDKSGTSIAGFTPATKQVLQSSSTNNIAYGHFNSGLFPRISFGNLYAIKELHPYVQVLKAELEVYPVKESFGNPSVYKLPAAMELRTTDGENYINGTPLSYSNGVQLVSQTGNLSIDELYGENTVYTYDVTDFVNIVLSEGAFSARALVLHPDATTALANDQRLLINNSAGNKATKLKLYILGL